jgi:hypothetical protein
VWDLTSSSSLLFNLPCNAFHSLYFNKYEPCREITSIFQDLSSVRKAHFLRGGGGGVENESQTG